MRKYFFIFLLFFLPTSYVSAQNWDIRILEALNSSHPLDEPFWHQGVSNSIYWIPTSYFVSNLTYGLGTGDKRALHYGMESGMSFVISQIFTEVLKTTVNRPRPYISYPGKIQSYSYNSSKSFPSGHTSTSFAIATTMAYQTQRWYYVVPIMIWPTSVGYSRMRLGKHYPSDVLVGALIGIGSGILSHWLTNQILGDL